MQVVRVPDVVLARVFNPAFFLTAGIFILVFGMISLNLLHETIAAFFGVAAVFAISYFIGSSNSDYWIIGFREAVAYIDFDVIFLLMTMMIAGLRSLQYCVQSGTRYSKLPMDKRHLNVLTSIGLI